MSNEDSLWYMKLGSLENTPKCKILLSLLLNIIKPEITQTNNNYNNNMY